MSGNTSKAGDNGKSFGKSFLFLLTTYNNPGIELIGDRVIVLVKAVYF